MEITKKNNTSFTALRIKKNIINDLPQIYKTHEQILRREVEETDKFISAYGTVLPERMLKKVSANQKDNKQANIVFGKFRFGFTPFRKKEPGIAIEKGNHTIMKKPLGNEVYRENRRIPHSVPNSYRTLTYEYRSRMYDQFEEAEKIANSLEKFSKTHKMLGSIEIEGADKVLQQEIEKAPFIKELRQKHNVDVFTNLESSTYNNLTDYQRNIYIDWRDDCQGTFILQGIGSTPHEADEAVIKQLRECPLSDMQNEIWQNHNLDISKPTILTKNSHISLLQKFITFFRK